MNEIEIIGGKADGTKILTAPKIVIDLRLHGESYVPISFKRQKEDKRQVTIYISAGMIPAEAIKIWKTRHPL